MLEKKIYIEAKASRNVCNNVIAADAVEFGGVVFKSSRQIVSEQVVLVCEVMIKAADRNLRRVADIVYSYIFISVRLYKVTYSYP